jgi:hypothetical protein
MPCRSLGALRIGHQQSSLPDPGHAGIQLVGVLRLLPLTPCLPHAGICYGPRHCLSPLCCKRLPRTQRNRNALPIDILCSSYPLPSFTTIHYPLTFPSSLPMSRVRSQLHRLRPSLPIPFFTRSSCHYLPSNDGLADLRPASLCPMTSTRPIYSLCRPDHASPSSRTS